MPTTQNQKNGEPSMPPLVMPPRLKSLVLTNAAGASSATSEEREEQCKLYMQSAAHPTPTLALLQQVEALQGAFLSMVKIIAQQHAIQHNSSSGNAIETTGTSVSSSSSGSTADSIQKLEEMHRATDHLVSIISGIQMGIRSKIGQTSRFAIIEQLKKEIDERRRAVNHIDSVLQSIRRAQDGSATNS